MLKNSLTGFENRLKTEAPHLSKGQRRAAAKRIAYRMERMTETSFYESCRILGILSDTTARDAIRNLEKVPA
ncbi:MAG: hypothetical protein ACTH9H_13690 [Galactobacter sp.]